MYFSAEFILERWHSEVKLFLFKKLKSAKIASGRCNENEGSDMSMNGRRYGVIERNLCMQQNDKTHELKLSIISIVFYIHFHNEIIIFWSQILTNLDWRIGIIFSYEIHFVLLTYIII